MPNLSSKQENQVKRSIPKHGKGKTRFLALYMHWNVLRLHVTSRLRACAVGAFEMALKAALAQTALIAHMPFLQLSSAHGCRARKSASPRLYYIVVVV